MMFTGRKFCEKKGGEKMFKITSKEIENIWFLSLSPAKSDIVAEIVNRILEKKSRKIPLALIKTVTEDVCSAHPSAIKYGINASELFSYKVDTAFLTFENGIRYYLAWAAILKFHGIKHPNQTSKRKEPLGIREKLLKRYGLCDDLGKFCLEKMLLQLDWRLSVGHEEINRMRCKWVSGHGGGSEFPMTNAPSEYISFAGSYRKVR